MKLAATTTLLATLLSLVGFLFLVTSSLHAFERAQLHQAFVADMEERMCLQSAPRAWACPVVQAGIPTYRLVIEP